jgi:hypothetical protein
MTVSLALHEAASDRKSNDRNQGTTTADARRLA